MLSSSTVSSMRSAARQVIRRGKATVENATSSSSSSSGTATTTKTASTTPILSSLAAALGGVTLVSVGAAVVENMTADQCLPYSSTGQRFDQSDFQGRFARMLLACDPRLLLYSAKDIEQAQALLKKADSYQEDRSMDRTLWEARRVVDAALHPDTGATIPLPFRMSGYVPFNGPICVAMVASTTTPQLLFWSWVNQSQNALVNYYNRNASSPMSNETLAASYSTAVGSALVVAFGLATLIQKRCTPDRAQQLMKFVAFPSAVVASSLNCYIVRSPEIESGIPLLDANYQPVILEDGSPAISKAAAAQGVYSTTLSRAILQAPVYFLPPVLMGVLPPLSQAIERNPRLRVPLTTALVLVSFGLGLPATTAIFPQMTSIPATDVEAPFQNLQSAHTQTPYTVYYYNKGL